MNADILVIEDVAEMSELICMYLKNAGFSTTAFDTAEKALDFLSNGSKPSLILLDLNLPGMSGLEFIKKFRTEINKSIPVIIVSARDTDEDIISGLGYGADDFITKPFSPKILVARVKNKLVRQAETETAYEKTVAFGDYTLYLNSCILKKGIERIPLSSKEFDVLEFLCTHPEESFTPEKIYEAVWKNQYGDITAVAVYIQRLRKKIGEDPVNPRHIKTVFGMGYKFTL